MFPDLHFDWLQRNQTRFHLLIALISEHQLKNLIQSFMVIFTIQTNQQHTSKENWLKTRNLNKMEIRGQESCDLIKK